MRQLCLLLLFAMRVCRAEDAGKILQRVKESVIAQLAKSANYTCVETIDRSYFASKVPPPEGCSELFRSQLDLTMHDRLRLDVAVSQGSEIYAWHGENKFSSSPLFQIVGSGPISSGNFIGFLRNIFTHDTVRFIYTGTVEENGLKVHAFQYSVPLAASGYYIEPNRGGSIVAYHGTFAVSALDYHLTRLQIIADWPPKQLNLCSIETKVVYQLPNIGGKASLIPQGFELHVRSDSHEYTLSRSNYSQCREFSGESTLRFDMSNAATSPSAESPILDQLLPTGVYLHVRLQTPIDDRTSYTGDPVEGVLLDPVFVPETSVTIPKGALVRGVIVQLAHYTQLFGHFLVRVQFERLTYGSNSFIMKAVPQTPRQSILELRDLYGTGAAERAEKGPFAFGSSHIHLDSRFSAIWKTVKPDEATVSNSGK